MDSFNRTLQTSGIKLTIIWIVTVVYALVFPKGCIYLGPTAVLFMGLCLIIAFAIPAFRIRCKIKKEFNGVLPNDFRGSLYDAYRTYTIVSKMFSWLGGIMVVIGTLFTLLNYYGVV